MNKRMIIACLAVAAATTMGAVFAVQAQDAGVTANDYANANANANVNVPPPNPEPPAPPSEPTAGVNGNNVNAQPPANVPPSETHDLIPPKQDAVTAEPHLIMAPTQKPEPAEGAASSAEGKRVKIPNPEAIRFFQDIKQIGNSLFGILRNNAKAPGATADQEKTSTARDVAESAAGQNADQQLEKILTPDMIRFYTAIKKIGTSLFGVRKDGAGPKNVAPKKRHIVTAEESACVIAAIKAKDQAIIDGKTAETTTFTAAVVVRTDCQTAALGTTEGQGAALELCSKNFATDAVRARDAFAKAQKDAWTTYTAAIKACVPSPSTASGQTSADENIIIEDGNNAL